MDTCRDFLVGAKNILRAILHLFEKWVVVAKFLALVANYITPAVSLVTDTKPIE